MPSIPVGFGGGTRLGVNKMAPLTIEKRPREGRFALSWILLITSLASYAVPAHASAQTGLAANGLIATEDAKLTSSDVTQDDVLGWSVAISGDTAVAGAPYDDAPLSDQGSVYVFVRGDTGWVQQAHLKAPDAARGDNFGWSVAVEGDTIAVGSPDDDLAHGNMGSVHVYARSGSAWTHHAKLTGSSGWVGDHFGSSVAQR